jgi:anti-anti-sigma factor
MSRSIAANGWHYQHKTQLQKGGGMQVSSLIQATTPVITLSGPIEFSSRKMLRTVIDDGLAQGCRDFILDLQGVTFIDSSGLGALVACFSTVRKQGGSMKLVRVPKQVYHLMEITKLTHFFDIFETPEAALQTSHP